MHSHDDDGDDDAPSLTDEQADEAFALMRTALGDHATTDAPIEGDLELLIGNAMEHSLPARTLWLEQSTIGISLCPSCGAVLMYFLSQESGVIHGAMEIIEHLRQQGARNLGSDPNDIVCLYRRVRIVVEGEPAEIYVFGAVYWLDVRDADDPAILATRSLVTAADEIITAVTVARQQAALLRHLTEEN